MRVFHPLILALTATLLTMGCPASAPNAETAEATPSAAATPKATPAATAPKPGSKIDGPAAKALVAAKATLLDVRTVQEFADHHLPGAVNIPVQDLQARVGELGAKDVPVVVYCHSGARSEIGLQMLENAGWTAVYDMGPIAAWGEK